MTWSIEFLEEAEKDMKKLGHSAQIQVLKGIRKVSQNPLPTEEGGYGKLLGNEKLLLFLPEPMNRFIKKLQEEETSMIYNRIRFPCFEPSKTACAARSASVKTHVMSFLYKPLPNFVHLV